jgi:hypothetical protein
MYLSFSILEGCIAISSRIFECLHTGSSILQNGRVFIQSGRVILNTGMAKRKNPRWIKDESDVLQTLSIMIEESLGEFWKNKYLRLASLVSSASEILSFNKIRSHFMSLLETSNDRLFLRQKNIEPAKETCTSPQWFARFFVAEACLMSAASIYNNIKDAALSLLSTAYD